MAKRASDPDELKARAIEAARQIMRENGPDGVKARVIAARLGVSVGTVYNLFGDLDALFLAVNATVYDALYGAVTAALREAQDQGAGIEAQMTALAGAYLSFVAENSELWSAVLSYNRRSMTPPPDWYREKERALLSVISRTIAALPGAAPEAARNIATRALWAAVHGIVTVSVARGRLLVPETEIRAQLDLVVEAMASRLEAGKAGKP